MEEFANLRRVAINELRKLDAKYAGKEEFEPNDAKTYDCLMHGLKCQLTAEDKMKALAEPAEAVSGRLGRAMNGRYVSRDGMSDRQSYDEGYSRGYQDAQSGYWQMPPHYPRSW